MAAHSHAGHGSLDNPDTTHETTDINVRAILWFVAVLTLVVLSMNASMWAMFRVLQHYERKNEPYVTPLARPAALPKDFPEPRLQTTPWTDLRTLRAEQQDYLHGYGWVDEKLGVARIPIDKAKQMLLQRGLPVRPELADDTEGTHLAATGESNGGRTIPAGGADRSSAVSGSPAAAPAAPQGAGTAAPAKPGGAPTPGKPGGASAPVKTGGAAAPVKTGGASAPVKTGGGR